MTIEQIITIAGVVLGSNWIGNLILEMYKNKKAEEKEPDVYEEMVLALVRDKLLFLTKKYQKKKYIPDDEFESFETLGKSYIKAKGNSLVKHKFEEALNLPIKEEGNSND